VICALCLGLEHAELALADGGCDFCESLPLSSLRARLLAARSAPAPPSTSPRKKKRRSQRPPEPSAEQCGPPPPPPASRSPSPPLPDIQLPPSGRSVDSVDAAVEKDSCSLLASDSEEWSSLGSTRESTRTRAGIEEELMRLLSQAVERLGLEWSPPPEQAPNRMDGSFFHRRSTPACNRAAPETAPIFPPRCARWTEPPKKGTQPCRPSRTWSPHISARPLLDGALPPRFLQKPAERPRVFTLAPTPPPVRPPQRCTRCLSFKCYRATSSVSGLKAVETPPPLSRI
jgi:hypothetical protein